ncbi:MAG: DUF1761 domain-containing protein [Gammaproteobacteria bacterium]|nr:DUF1761 domain-containing protein [Gammaproteobacteria bacterium]
MDINLWGVLCATVASFVLGGLWYSKPLFGTVWIRETGIDEAAAAHPAKVFGLTFVYTLITAIALSWLLGPYPSLIEGIRTGLVVGVGFVACSFGVNYQFSMKSGKLLSIDAGFHIMQFLIMGIILGIWP